MASPSPAKPRRAFQPKNFVPRWYMNVDAAIKPLIGAGIVLAGVVPLLIYAWRQSVAVAGHQDTLNQLLDSGVATKAQVLAVAEQMHSATTKTMVALLIAPYYGFIA